MFRNRNEKLTITSKDCEYFMILLHLQAQCWDCKCEQRAVRFFFSTNFGFSHVFMIVSSTWEYLSHVEERKWMECKPKLTYKACSMMLPEQ